MGVFHGKTRPWGEIINVICLWVVFLVPLDIYTIKKLDGVGFLRS